MSELFERALREAETTHLREMATVCKKMDGFGIIIEVYSEDHGVLGNKKNPAHAHLKTASGDYLGKFVITTHLPRSIEYVFDCDKNNLIPIKYKEIIVKWAKSKNKNGVLGWTSLKMFWEGLHP